MYLYFNSPNKFRSCAFSLGEGVNFSAKLDMKMKKRQPYNNMLNVELIKSLKILAVKQDKRQNDLLEEAMRDLLKKYGKRNVPEKALVEIIDSF